MGYVTSVTDRTDAGVRGQLAAYRRVRVDHRLRRELLRRIQARRAGRPDLVQFEVLPDGDRSETLAVRGELLIRSAELGSTAVADLVSDWALQVVPVPGLDGRVAKLVDPVRPGSRGPHPDGRLRALWHDAVARGLPVSVDHVTAMGHDIRPVPAPPGPASYGGGGGPVVAVLDTGIAARPRADGWLAGVAGRDNIDPLDAISPAGELDQGAGHGTFAAGVVAQLAPSADIRAYRVLDSAGIGSELDVACAMLRAAADGAAVLNLSLGTRSVDDKPPVAVAAALELLAERHPEVLVVAAAGDDGDTRPCWPAAFPDVVAVAGLDPDLAPGEWSNRGEWVTCSTLGEGVVSPYVTGRHPADGPRPAAEFGPDAWAGWTGTSFAAPQVAGAVAARIAASPGTSPRAALAGLLAEGRPTPGFGRALSLLPAAA